MVAVEKWNVIGSCTSENSFSHRLLKLLHKTRNGSRPDRRELRKSSEDNNNNLWMDRKGANIRNCEEYWFVKGREMEGRGGETMWDGGGEWGEREWSKMCHFNYKWLTKFSRNVTDTHWFWQRLRFKESLLRTPSIISVLQSFICNLLLAAQDLEPTTHFLKLLVEMIHLGTRSLQLRIIIIHLVVLRMVTYDAE